MLLNTEDLRQDGHLCGSIAAADSNADALVGLVGPPSSDAQRLTPWSCTAPVAGELAEATVWTLGPCAHGGSSYCGLGKRNSGFVKGAVVPRREGRNPSSLKRQDLEPGSLCLREESEAWIPVSKSWCLDSRQFRTGPVE